MKKLTKHGSDRRAELSEILEYVWGFQKSKTLLAACEFDIFSVIGDEEKSAEFVAEQTNANPGAIARLMNALCAMGLLHKIGSDYSNTSTTRQYLVKDSPDYIAIMGHYSNLYDRWSTLPEAVRQGTSVNYRITDDIKGDSIKDFIAAMHWRASNQALEIINMVYLSHSKRLIDIGGGSGAYAMEFLRAKPDMEVTIFDLPQVIPHTQRNLAEYGLEDKIKTIAGDYFIDDIGKGYDVAFLSSVIHSNSIWENIELAKKIYFALNPGGQIIIHDFIINDERTKPLFTSLFSLNMLINTVSGDVYTETDVWITLKEAWFKDVKFYPTKFDTKLIIGKK